MALKAFEARTFGKWILAGEHAVIRGAPALAFPLLSRSLHIQYTPSPEPLQVHFGGTHGREQQLLFWGVLEKALQTLSLHVSAIGGELRVESELPVGAGLGASAALCAAVGLWCERQGFIERGEVYEFSRRLEDLFHGESSGVDIAVSLSGQGIRFVRGEDFVTIRPAWSPKVYLSYCGQRGVTSECVAKVKALLQSNPPLGQRLDQQMRDAVGVCERSLQLTETEGLSMLKNGLLLARDCFEHWGLVSGELQRHMRELEQAGAWAVKPTGSGGGGYTLSLWKDEPPANLRHTLIHLEMDGPQKH